MIRSFHSMQATNSIIEPPVNLAVNIEEYVVSDVLLKIFSLLNFQDISQCISLVSKKWEALSNDPDLLKNVIWNETFNPTDWNRFFPDIALTEFDCNYAFNSLPKTIGAMYKGPCPTFLNKKLGQTHVFVWMPKNLSINKFDALVKKYFPEKMDIFRNITHANYVGMDLSTFMDTLNKRLEKFAEENKNNFGLAIDTDVLDAFGDVMTEESEWLIMPKNNLPIKIGGTFAEHQNIVNALELSNFKSCSFPTVLEGMVSVSTTFFKTHEEILNVHATFCKEDINNSAVIFSVESSLFLTEVIDGLVQEEMSSAPIRKFKSVT